jgi:hypothetical protein
MILADSILIAFHHIPDIRRMRIKFNLPLSGFPLFLSGGFEQRRHKVTKQCIRKTSAQNVRETGFERAVLVFCAGQGEWIRLAPRGVKKMTTRQRQISLRRLKLTLYKRYSQ